MTIMNVTAIAPNAVVATPFTLPPEVLAAGKDESQFWMNHRSRDGRLEPMLTQPYGSQANKGDEPDHDEDHGSDCVGVRL